MHARRKVRACMAGGPLNFSPVKPAAIYLFVSPEDVTFSRSACERSS